MIDNLFTKLDQIFNDKIKLRFSEGNITLEDSGSKPIKFIKTGKILSIKTDFQGKSFDKFPYFIKTEENVCTINDFLLFYMQNETLYVFIIEIKSKNTHNSLEQLRAGFELAKYFIFTARRLLKYKSFNIEYRGLIFTEKQIRKGTTKPKRLEYIKDKSELYCLFLKSNNTYKLSDLAQYRLK